MAGTDEAVLADLMIRTRAGNEHAYRAFFNAVLQMVRASARGGFARYGHDGRDSEDVVQDVLLAIHTKRHTWRETEPITPWVRAITRYKVIDHLRRTGRRGKETPVEDIVEILLAEAGEDPTVRGDMERMIARLPARAGDIVRAIGLNGDTVGDVAERFSMTEGAVRVALHRALRNLARSSAGDLSS